MASSNILTGQYVHISQTPASIGDRMVAQLIDWAIQFAWLGGNIYLVSQMDTHVSEDFLIIYYVLVAMLPTFFYSIICCVLNNGQSIGKRCMKMRVVKKDGSQPGIGAYLMRWLLMIIDGPMMSGLGLVFMLISKNNQRLGDMAAGTIVIKLNSYNKLQVSLDEFSHFSSKYRPLYPAAEDLSLEQINLISQTMQLSEADPRVHALAEQVKQTLHIDHVFETDDAAFLWRVVRDYQYYALEEI